MAVSFERVVELKDERGASGEAIARRRAPNPKVQALERRRMTRKAV